MQQPGTVTQPVTQQPVMYDHYNGQGWTCKICVDQCQAENMVDQHFIVVASSAYSQHGNDPDYGHNSNGYRHLAKSVIKYDDIPTHCTFTPEHVACDKFLQLSQTMSDEDTGLSNRLNIQSIHKICNNHKMSPWREGHPNPQNLDVLHMTPKNPHSNRDGTRQRKCGEGNTSIKIHDGWNNLIFSMLDDIEAGERNQGVAHSQNQQQMNQILPQDMYKQEKIKQHHVNQIQSQDWQHHKVNLLYP